jgi:hypothetical protein
MSSKLFKTSVHEAGHGTMAILVGYLSRYVTNLRDSTSLGRMYWAPGQRVPFKVVQGLATSEERARALVFVAGVAAERALIGNDAQLASIDAEHANAYGRTTSAGEEAAVRTLLSDAEQLFADEHVRNATLTIAHRLLRDRVVFGSDMEAIIEGVGLQRGAAVILRAALGRPSVDGVPRRVGNGIIGDSAFVDADSTRYFFPRR